MRGTYDEDHAVAGLVELVSGSGRALKSSRACRREQQQQRGQCGEAHDFRARLLQSYSGTRLKPAAK
eukprot:363901-Chlamydomonas_euryale.AAC.30